MKNNLSYHILCYRFLSSFHIIIYINRYRVLIVNVPILYNNCDLSLYIGLNRTYMVHRTCISFVICCFLYTYSGFKTIRLRVDCTSEVICVIFL